MTEPTTSFAHLSCPDGADQGTTWTWNVATGEVTWADGVDQALFGLPRGSFAATFEGYVALVHPDDRAYFRAVIERTLAGEDEYVMSHRVVWPDGSTHWIDGRGQLTRDAQARPLLLRGVTWTATARRRSEGRLLHLHRVEAVASAVRRELLRVDGDRQAFQHACRIAVEHGHFRFAWIGTLGHRGGPFSPLASAGVDDGYFREIAATSSSLPAPFVSAVQKGLPSVVNDIATDDSFRPWREDALRRGYRACGAFPLRRGGEIAGALVIYSAEENRFDADSIELLRGLSDDIDFKLDAIDTEARRRAAEQAMRHSEERYRALVEQAADAIFLADADDTLLDVNAAGCAMTGSPREEMIGRKLADLLEPTDRSEPRLALGTLPGSRIAGERRVRRKDGGAVDVELTVTVLADGRVQGYARDVTDRKTIQKQLILADRLTSLGRLAAGVAHEVNTPLAYVAMNLERIERAAVAAGVSPARSVLEVIGVAAAEARDGAERVRAIVRSLGALGRDDEGAIEDVDIHQVLESAVRLSANNVRHRGRLVKEYGATRRARGNELRLGQVFVNLLINASDALRDGTVAQNEIRVRTFDEGDRVIVEVRDNGMGIAPDIRDRIFDPFFTTKPAGDGTGLGLAISHGIVSAFGGSIDVVSDARPGAVFRVSLVAARAQPLERAHDPAAKRETSPRVRVLIVDDEERLAWSLAALLRHHTVTVLTSASDAVALCRKETFDCVVCDLMMPGLSGMDLHAELVRAGRGQERDMIFMTGGVFTARARAFVAEIAATNEVLEKPFSWTDLENAISAVLARKAGYIRPHP